MLIRHDESGAVDALKLLLDEMASSGAVTALMILACDGNRFLPVDVDPVLQRAKIPVFGGIFPAIIYGKHKYDKGTIVVGLQQTVQIAVVHGLNDGSTCYQPQITNWAGAIEEKGTVFVFVDGYSTHVGDFLVEFEKCYPESGDVIGGGAGSALPMINGTKATPSVFTNQGLLEGCAVVAHVVVQCGVGVRHGFEPVEGPFQITSETGNALVALDGEPALQMYKQMVSLYSGQQLQSNNLADFFKAYPLGLISNENGFIVRDLLAARGDQLVTVTHIPKGEFVYLVTGDKDTLIGAAIEANKEALAYFGDGTRSMTILVECVSRALFLGEDLTRELAVIGSDDYPVIGFFSLGEIAKCNGNRVALYNKTCVVGIFGE